MLERQVSFSLNRFIQNRQGLEKEASGLTKILEKPKLFIFEVQFVNPILLWFPLTNPCQLNLQIWIAFLGTGPHAFYFISHLDVCCWNIKHNCGNISSFLD